MCPVWFHAFSIKSDQGSQGRPKGNAVYVKFPIPPSLFITQVLKKKVLKSSSQLFLSTSTTFHLFIYLFLDIFIFKRWWK